MVFAPVELIRFWLRLYGVRRLHLHQPAWAVASPGGSGTGASTAGNLPESILNRFAVDKGRGSGDGRNPPARGMTTSGIYPASDGNGGVNPGETHTALRLDSGMIERAAVEEEIPAEIKPWGIKVTLAGAAIFLGLFLFTLFGPDPKRPESAPVRKSPGERKVVMVTKKSNTSAPTAPDAELGGPFKLKLPGVKEEPSPPSLPPKQPPRKLTKPRGGSVVLKNASFESNSIPDSGEGDPNGWTRGGAGGGGVSDSTQPAAAGTTIPDGVQVAFLPGGATLTQGLAGLTAFKGYWVQFYYSRRQDGAVPGLSVSYAGESVGTVAEISSGAEYECATFSFRSAKSSGDLVFTNTAADPAAVVLIDCVSVLQRDSDQIVLHNTSFNGSLPKDAFTAPDAPVAGWTKQGKVFVQQATGQGFHDNGLSDGPAFAVLQDEAWLRQTIKGLEPGKTYELCYGFNARQENFGGTPKLRVTIGDVTVQDEEVWAVGTFNPFQQMAFEFKADRPEMDLEFRQTESGDRTIFVDNVAVRVLKEIAGTPDAGPGQP
ncbi:MAG: hypothetical protein A3K19_14605 [Lentisphaerae bacterium RIFOXYB12_FULL_65_16]|nr:MAG: hypothetical protein A3K18_28670 [Lentisphaerae bacterium RIFOXYA12_64_32]OGV87453.1 MAG: hypothetical protein A3K19_14605 [Lentisphaerae bacterium RIFOXYB12_FULL_65_16]